MKKQPGITEKTRQAFIAVFCELYRQKPIQKISIREIAAQSGYNRSTFYQYFTDIYDLLNAVENDLLRYIKEALSNERSATNAAENMAHCFENENHISALRALLGDYGSIRFLERLKKEIPLDQWVLNLSPEDAMTPYLIEFYISTTLSLFQFWFRRQKDLPPDALLRLIHNLHSGGISSIASKERI